MVDASPAGAPRPGAARLGRDRRPVRAAGPRRRPPASGRAPDPGRRRRPDLGRARPRRPAGAARLGAGARRARSSTGCAWSSPPPRSRSSPLAGAAIDRVHARMADWLRVGRTEAEVGADIAAAILEEGHIGVDFTIVGSGPNGASPHHELSGRTVEAGDLVVVDIGGETATGYRSDCTRTYVVGGVAVGRASPSGTPSCRPRRRPPIAAVRPGRDRRGRRRRGPPGDRRRRLGRALHPPHRARHRAGHPRGALHRRRQRRCRWSRAWRSPWSRASTWPAAAAPASRTSSSAPTTASAT